MIAIVEFDMHPFKPGESRVLTLQADEPSTIQIRCFVSNPPPPGYKPCDECGTFRTITNDQPVWIVADAQVFAREGGTLEIDIRDAAGDQRVLRIGVTRSDADAAPAANNAMMAG